MLHFLQYLNNFSKLSSLNSYFLNKSLCYNFFLKDLFFYFAVLAYGVDSSLALKVWNLIYSIPSFEQKRINFFAMASLPL